MLLPLRVESIWRARSFNSPMTLLQTSSHSSVDRAPYQCLGGHGFNSCQGLRLFICPTLVYVDQFNFHIKIGNKFFVIKLKIHHLYSPIGTILKVNSTYLIVFYKFFKNISHTLSIIKEYETLKKQSTFITH